MFESCARAAFCIDLPGGDARNGNRLWLWECSGSDNQKWQTYQQQGRATRQGRTNRSSTNRTTTEPWWTPMLKHMHARQASGAGERPLARAAAGAVPWSARPSVRDFYAANASHRPALVPAGNQSLRFTNHSIT